MGPLPDKRVIACNYKEATSIARLGALAYVSWTTGGALPGRALVLVRSRSGRWVEKWEHLKRLHNFRFKTLPSQHPRYNDTRIADYHTQDILDTLRLCSEAGGNDAEYVRLWKERHA